MLILVCIPIGMTFGAATWALIRGRGGIPGLVLSMVAGVISSFVGGLAAQAIAGPSSAPIGLGAAAGGLLASVVVAVGWGPRPKRVR